MKKIKHQITKEKIQNWLIAKLAEELNIQASEVDITASFSDFGVNSLAITGILGDLEEWLGTDLEETILWDYPSIESVAKYIETELNE